MPQYRPGKGYLLPDEIDPERIGVCVPVPNDDNHRRAFLGALYDLTWSRNWQGDKETRKAVANVWLDVYEQVEAALGVEFCEAGDTGHCVNYSNKSAFIEYGPNDPRYTPDLVPEGYASPPWYFATAASNLAYGSFDGDILTSFERLPLTLPPITPPFTGLWPWIKFNFVGEGEIELHFRSLVLGGLALVTHSADPFYVSFVDCNKDLSGIPPETEANVIHELSFVGEGPHWVQVNVLPRIDTEEIPVSYGLGLSKVVLCGEIAPPGEEPELPLELEIIGDDLALTYDGETISTLPKASLQDLLDKWVDEVGDTMTGQLDMKSPSNSHLAMYQDQTILAAYMQTFSNNFYLIKAAPGETRIQRNDGTALNRFRADGAWFYSTASLPLPPWGSFRFTADNSQSGFSVRNNHVSGDLLRAYDNLAVLRYAMAYNGELTINRRIWMQDYSSTELWREQGLLESGFVGGDPTDATRLGYLLAMVWGHAGGQVAWRAENNDDGDMKLAFRDSTPITRPSAATIETIQQGLADYGLFDFTAGEFPPVEPPSGNYRRCNAAWFIAGAMAALVSDIIENLQTLTPAEVLTGTLDGYGLYVSQTYQLLSYIELQLSDWDTINDDISDSIADLAQTLYDGNFDINAVVDWVNTFAGYSPATAITIVYLLSALLPSQWEQWIAVGSETPSGQLCGEYATCEEIAEQNFRFGVGAWIIDQGYQVIYGGIHSETDGDNIYARVHCETENCPYTNIEIEWWAENAVNDQINVFRGTRDEFGVMTWGGVQPIGPSGPVPGEQFNAISISGGSGWDGIRISTQAASDGTGYQNIIRSVRLYEV